MTACCKKEEEQAAPFSDVIEEIIFGYASDEILQHPYFEIRASHKYGVIIVTSDRGLWQFKSCLFKSS